MATAPIETVAWETFGFEALRPGQREAIESVLDGRDTLVAMSTGSGKSVICEIAGVMKPGVTIVISLDNRKREGFVFLAPERLAESEVLDNLRAAAPTLIAVDDAHCIAESGEDFCPDYLRLGPFIAEMGHPTVLALTSSPATRDEIVEKLHLHDPTVIVRGFE
jgi:ATP-dependent DNA helicase RecQ